jgi:hypothetical protein
MMRRMNDNANELKIWFINDIMRFMRRDMTIVEKARMIPGND